MRKQFKGLLLTGAMIAIVWIVSATPVFGQPNSKIVCLGNYLTMGGQMIDSLHNRYPAQLQQMLRDDYQVSAVDYTNEDWMSALDDLVEQSTDLLFFEIDPSIVQQSLLGDVIERLVTLQKKNTRIVLLPSFTSKKHNIASLYPLAQTTGLELIDLRKIVLEKGENFVEGTSLSSIGATVIAQRLYEVVKMQVEHKSELFTQLDSKESEQNFYGYTCLDFQYQGREAKIVKPKRIAKGAPWIWRARFWGHEPQLDIALLERGYHLVYCDVAELFGNEEAIAIWNDFYTMLTKEGLHTKSVMEGMSRGGVYVYNWLLAYPDRVRAVYADAPVLDLRSWPGGLGESVGSKGDWELFKENYKLTEREARVFNRSPLDRAEEVAKLKVPLLHVVGDADEVVPIAENTTPFKERIQQMGGIIEVLHKPNIGHHPHSLQDPSPIVDFLLRAEGRKLNFAAIAAPGSEFRAGAGWHPNEGWWGEHHDIERILKEREGALDVLFVGNSITQGIGGTRRTVSSKPGLQSFDQIFKGLNWDCAGISGDRTQNVLWRLKNGRYKQAAPKTMVVTIGVNNFLNGDDAKEIAEGILTIKDWVVSNMPDTKLVLTGPLPVGISKDDPRRRKYEEVHAILKQRAKGRNVIYSPMDTCFLQEDGSLSLEDYSTDGIHLQSAGYEKWAKELGRIINN